MNDDHLIECLRILCSRFGEDDKDALTGRYKVAKEAGLSEQYLYQILTGKPMTNGNKRSIGRSARKKLDNAFPNWLSVLPEAQQTTTATRHTRHLVQKLCDIAEQVNDIGLKKLIKMIEAMDLPGLHPVGGKKRHQKAKAA